MSDTVKVVEEIKKLVEFNGQTMTREEFEKQSQEYNHKPGVSIIEVSPGVYKSRIQG